MKGPGVYLQEGNVCVGPFAGKEDAERFLILMELLGENVEGIRIVERNGSDGDERTVIHDRCCAGASRFSKS